ncbi:zinc ribbon domain-containing protein [Staphylococcus petrasii]|uniref:zinc ribbon domain-containing protein n=1 Tax=Staphylococcus petrasii TaxID=1276936 RepID=UPI001F5837C0|nr:zinc ribbon domain-containing protein [Staphylococcus petrasii]MCI2774296.1 zinc ribbon domain-containing protein [Staphylococcus petrasii]
MQCPNCGQTYQPGDLFCGECGTKLPAATSQSTPSTSESLNLDHNQSNTQKVVTSTTQSTSNAESTSEVHSNQSVHSQNVNQNEHYQSQYAQGYPSYQQRYAPGPFTFKVRAVVNESKQFFRQAFSSHDATIKSPHAFSYTLLVSLIILGLFIVGLFVHSFIPDAIEEFGITRTSITTRIVVGVAILTGVVSIATFAVIRLTVVSAVQFKKVLSDFVLVNTLTVSILLLGLISIFLQLYKVGGLLIVLSFFVLISSGIYLISKYSAHQLLRVPSFYSSIILIIIVSLVFYFYGSSLINQFWDTKYLWDILGSGRHGLL